MWKDLTQRVGGYTAPLEHLRVKGPARGPSSGSVTGPGSNAGFHSRNHSDFLLLDIQHHVITGSQNGNPFCTSFPFQNPILISPCHQVSNCNCQLLMKRAYFVIISWKTEFSKLFYVITLKGVSMHVLCIAARVTMWFVNVRYVSLWARYSYN